MLRRGRSNQSDSGVIPGPRFLSNFFTTAIPVNILRKKFFVNS